jgi:hypothetical protein
MQVPGFEVKIGAGEVHEDFHAVVTAGIPEINGMIKIEVFPGGTLPFKDIQQQIEARVYLVTDCHINLPGDFPPFFAGNSPAKSDYFIV